MDNLGPILTARQQQQLGLLFLGAVASTAEDDSCGIASLTTTLVPLQHSPFFNW